ncbi:MAG: ATP-binding cassette domain-containing protein [Desulfosudis oleivorans]|nr:ATP-binding cassette domain-containing protein [Desulfosudis oleivorans]
MGPSGSGKSTLLYALSGMDDVDGGKVTFDGARFVGAQRKRTRRPAPHQNGLCLPATDPAQESEHPRQYPPAVHARWSQKWRAAHRESQDSNGKNGHCRSWKCATSPRLRAGNSRRVGICRALDGRPENHLWR